MYVSDLALNDFRSYSEALLEFEPGVTTFVGRNGAGKTNIVEAIGYLGDFSSHRVSSDVALVRQGASAGVIRAKLRDGDRSTVLEVEIVSGRANRARVNRSAAKTRDAVGIVRSVIFSPEDLGLVKGDPQDRRRFLDHVVVQHSPRMAGVKSDYDKVLRQRSALLKSAGAAHRRGGLNSEMSATLEVWDAQLARLGAQLTSARVARLRTLRPLVEQSYEAVSSGGGPATIAYRASARAIDVPGQGVLGADEEPSLLDESSYEEQILTAIAQVRSKELDRGVCLVGPHRDDVELGLGTLPAKGYASHGESWSIALALRLASFDLLRDDDARGEPALILDDVFAELDAHRRERLAELVSDAGQVFITAAVGEDVPPALHGRRFTVAEGRVERDGDA